MGIRVPSGTDTDEADEAEIERIVTRKAVATGGWQYKVRWAGYGAEEDLWYTEAQLRVYAPTLVEAFNVEWEETQLSFDVAAMFEAFEKEGKISAQIWTCQPNSTDATLLVGGE